MTELVSPLARPVAPLALRDHWYVVGALAQLGPEPRVLTTCGRTAAFSVESGQLHCADPDFAHAVSDGYVWHWHGDGPQPENQPELPQVRVPRTVWERGTVAADANWSDFVENTLDLVHPMFAHPWTHPTWWLHRLGVRPVFETEIRMTPTGWIAEAFVDLPFKRRWRFMWQELTLPDRVRLVMSPPAMAPERGIAAGAMEVIAHHPPEHAGRTRMEYMMGRRAAPFEPARFKELPGGRPLHVQDQRLLEALAGNRLRFPEAREAHVATDAYTLLFRKVVAEVQAGRWATSWQSFPSPIVLRARI